MKLLLEMCYTVKFKTCRQLKDADGIFQLVERCCHGIFLLIENMPPLSKDATAVRSKLTLKIHEKLKLHKIPGCTPPRTVGIPSHSNFHQYQLILNTHTLSACADLHCISRHVTHSPRCQTWQSHIAKLTILQEFRKFLKRKLCP